MVLIAQGQAVAPQPHLAPEVEEVLSKTPLGRRTVQAFEEHGMGVIIPSEPTIQLPQTEPEVSIPTKMTDLLNFPLQSVLDMITLYFGTKEEQAMLAAGWVPVSFPSETPGEVPTTFTEATKDIITEQKEIVPGAEEYWKTAGVTNVTIPTINIPEFPNPFEGLGEALGWLKWVAIGGLGLIGLYLVGKLVGGKK